MPFRQTAAPHRVELTVAVDEATVGDCDDVEVAERIRRIARLRQRGLDELVERGGAALRSTKNELKRTVFAPDEAHPRSVEVNTGRSETERFQRLRAEGDAKFRNVRNLPIVAGAHVDVHKADIEALVQAGPGDDKIFELDPKLRDRPIENEGNGRYRPGKRYRAIA